MKNKILILLIAALLATIQVFAANSGTHETNVTILAGNFYIVSVTPPLNPNPAEYTTSTITTSFIATHENGASYINTSSAQCSYNKTGETTRTSTSCTPTNLNTTSINFSCDVTMYYYDAPSTWSIDCTVKDNSETTAQNNTQTFNYGSLTSMQLNYTGITFGSLLPGTIGDTGPYTVINTGNNAYTDMSIKAFNLTGLTDTGVQIPVTAFKADTTHGGYTGAIQLIENSAVSLSATIPRGPIPTGTRNVWYYLNTPPVIPQIYKASGATSWEVAGTP